jgi:hypothetical protein
MSKSAPETMVSPPVKLTQITLGLHLHAVALKLQAEGLKPVVSDYLRGSAGGSPEQVVFWDALVGYAKGILITSKGGGHKIEDLNLASASGSALVLNSIMTMEAKAQTIIVQGLDSDMAEAMADIDRAFQQLAALGSWFGGRSLQREENARAVLDKIKYRPGPAGSGMRTLVAEVVSSKKAIEKAGGVFENKEVMKTVLRRLRVHKVFDYERKNLEKEVDKGTLTIGSLRNHLVDAETENEAREVDDSDSEPEEKAPSVQVAMLAMFTKLAGVVEKQGQQMTALATQTAGGGRGGRGGGGRQGNPPARPAGEPPGTCYPFADTGECRFGARCRFTH